ncbi:hypothetical protein VCR3J2_40125 [Vibrio coralliirubri]|nr:hypothetical protein VCR3J2_40125 [Vibrio coralliirubri]
MNERNIENTTKIKANNLLSFVEIEYFSFLKIKKDSNNQEAK